MGLDILAAGSSIPVNWVSHDPAVIGLTRTPWRRPADWAHDGYYAIDVAQLREMREARELTLVVEVGDGPPRRFALFDPDASSLQAFVDSLD